MYPVWIQRLGPQSGAGPQCRDGAPSRLSPNTKSNYGIPTHRSSKGRGDHEETCLTTSNLAVMYETTIHTCHLRLMKKITCATSAIYATRTLLQQNRSCTGQQRSIAAVKIPERENRKSTVGSEKI